MVSSHEYVSISSVFSFSNYFRILLWSHEEIGAINIYHIGAGYVCLVVLGIYRHSLNKYSLFKRSFIEMGKHLKKTVFCAQEKSKYKIWYSFVSVSKVTGIFADHPFLKSPVDKCREKMAGEKIVVTQWASTRRIHAKHNTRNWIMVSL